VRANGLGTRRIATRAAAVLGILALGVGAGFAGSRLAAPSEGAAAPVTTEIIPVVAPVARALDASPEDTDGDEDTFDVSPAIGQIEVPLGDADRGEVAAAVTAIGSADDPVTVYDLPVLDGEGDPCASDADPSAECPDGIRGTILGITGTAFAVFPVLNPPLPAEGGYSVQCPASDPPIDPEARDRMRFGVGSTAPAASMTVVYHPVGQPDAAREITAMTTADARTTWEESPFIAAGAKPLISHCFTLDELDPALRYQVTVTAEGDAGATDTESRYFGLEQDLTRPPVRIVPLLQNVIFTSVPHRAGQSVSVKALPLGDGGPTECGAEEGLLALPPVTEPTTTQVDIEYLESNGFLPDFAKRTGQAFYLEEGSSVLLCLFVYDDDRPSWSWDTAEYRYSVAVHAPDVTVPTVTLTDIRLHPSFRSDGHVSIRAEERGGRDCGGRSFTLATVEELYFASGEFEELLCNQDELSGGGNVRSGDVIVQAIIGEARNAVLLPLSSLACSGACELPESATYQLLLPTTPVASGLCGSSFGDCEPPTSEVAAGTATFRVDWVQGNQNGQSGWAVGELAESTPETAPADRPRLNTRAAVVEVTDGSGFHLEVELATDRPAGFAAVLSGDCILPDTVIEVTGETGTDGRLVRFADVCHGSSYRVSVLLFDGDTVTPYGDGFPDGYWPGGSIRTTSIEKRLNLGYTIADLDAGRNTSLIRPLDVQVNDQRVDLEVMEWGKCFYGDSLSRRGMVDTVGLAELVTVRVSVGIANGNGAPESDAYPVCAEADAGEQYTFLATIPLADLTTRGVEVAAPDDAPFAFAVWIGTLPS
jgi:hypothetical protein